MTVGRDGVHPLSTIQPHSLFGLLPREIAIPVFVSWQNIGIHICRFGVTICSSIAGMKQLSNFDVSQLSEGNLAAYKI
jgi:hypothetical protein